MIVTIASALQKEAPLDFQRRTFAIMIQVFVYSSSLYFFSFVTADPDLWGHITFGKDLWETKTLPRSDVYSFTALGSEWTNHEWLSEVLMYMVYRAFDSAGLLVGKLLIGLAVVYLISKICFYRLNVPIVYGTIMVLSVFVLSPGFMIRPQILTFLFVAYFLYCFHLYFERGKNLLWSLPIIMVLWVNGHGGFLIGAGMFPVAMGCEYITCRLKNKETGHLRGMVFWLILTEAAVFMNPYGYHLLGFLYETLRLTRDISEWEPVTVFDFSYLRFKLLALFFISSFIIRNNERRYWEVGIIIIAMLHAFIHQRHTPVFAIVAAPYLIENFSLFIRRTGIHEKVRSFSSYAVLNIFLCTLVGYQLFATSHKYIKTQCNIIVDPSAYPIYAVHFLKQNGIRGNILLPFDWGEYAIWKLYPECKVSIDGRFRTVYPESVLNAHFSAAENESKLRELIAKYPSDIILGRQNPFYQRLIGNQEEWIYVYSDPISIVFLRNSSSQRDALKRLRRKELRYPDKSKPISVYFP